MRLRLTILFLLISLLLASQENQIDKLRKILPSVHDSVSIDRFNELSFQSIESSKKDSANYYATLAYQEAQKLNYIHGIAVSLSRRSRIAKHFDDDFARSETLAKESLSWYEKTTNMAGIGELYGELWYSLFAQSKYDEAYKYAEKEYEWCKITGNKFGMSDALINLSVIHYQQGNYDSSFHFIQQAHQIALTVQDDRLLTNILFTFGTLYRAIEDYPSR